MARALADVLFGLGLLPSNTIKETSALDLTGDYLGQTKTKVNNALKDAKGGILFIDEAYFSLTRLTTSDWAPTGRKLAIRL